MQVAALRAVWPNVGQASRDPVADALAARAARNYPDDPYLQREWIRAVGVVRRSARGWLLDNPARRVGGAA